jgi:hypothetical protein
MSEGSINQEVLDQCNRVLFKLREVIQNFPEDEWQKGDTPYQRPAGLAAHLIATIDFYTSGLTPDQFPWGKRLGVDWEDPDDEALPSQELILAYLAEMEERIGRWIERTDFNADEEVYPYTGKTVLGRTIYLIRHSEHHLAELNLELRRRGYLGPEWR